jgi:hypothetical protein
MAWWSFWISSHRSRRKALCAFVHGIGRLGPAPFGGFGKVGGRVR